MAAYAALVSLMHIIEQVQNHPRPPISLDKEQVASLTEKIAFLQDFLEAYNPHGGIKEADGLLSRIADAAHAAEDIIESHIADQILAQSTTHDVGKINSVDLNQDLQKAIEDVDLIKKEAMQIKDKPEFREQLLRRSTSAVSVRSKPTEQNIMVGIDVVLKEIMDKLTGQEPTRQIIPIVGMGGIGKTTLARNAYINPVMVQHFDVRSWVTISQQYDVKEILAEIICQITQDKRETLTVKSEKDLGLQLHKSLSGRRYMIIMDDMWSIEVWDKVRFNFPDNNNRSRMIITTRLSKLALDLVGAPGVEMKFLDVHKSWNLLCRYVFREGDCPIELARIGQTIAKNCKGLPLSIVVIGGLLAKSKCTREYWEYIAENLKSTLYSEENDLCLEILHMSYEQLPVHLKPCFLYMGIFPEDNKIRVSQLIKLWVAEGFIKPSRAKSLEESAKEYLVDLVNRNLILVSERGVSGKIKFCNIHDLSRELCLREAQKEKFHCVTSRHSFNSSHDEGINTQRCIAIRQIAVDVENCNRWLYAWRSVSHFLFGRHNSKASVPCLNNTILRVQKRVDGTYSVADILRLVKSRYLDFSAYLDQASFMLPSLIHPCWNLQTLVVSRTNKDAIPTLEIWKLPHLKHVKFDNLLLQDPPSDHMEGQDDFILGNLQTLSKIINFTCGEEVVKRIPNIKKLRLIYDDVVEGFAVASHYCLNNLGRLHELESIACSFGESNRPSRSDLLWNLTFPHLLKKLTLCGTFLYWEDMSTKIGSLPLLQVLKLQDQSFIGPKWETIEGQFLSLKYLLIKNCYDLECWTTESTHFPCLEQLVIWKLDELSEIPSGIGGIHTLQSIVLHRCSFSAIFSAKMTIEEQEELGNEGLRITVRVNKIDPHLESLKSRNFEVIEYRDFEEQFRVAILVSKSALSFIQGVTSNKSYLKGDDGNDSHFH